MLRIPVLSLAFVLWIAPTAAGQNCHLEGAWEVVSLKTTQPDGTVSISEIGDPPGLKILSKRHFIFVEQNHEGPVPTSGGGGSYVTNDTTFIETVQYHAARSFIGMELPFHCKVEDDHWYQSGYLPGGTYLEQVYRRLELNEMDQ